MLFDALKEAAFTGLIFFLIWIVLVGLELLYPRDRISWASRKGSLVFWAICIPAWALFGVLLARIWPNYQPLLSLRTGTFWLDVLIAVFLGNMVADFFFYWRHRIQHWFFWRYHAVHHSIRELSSVSSYHHISEEVFRIALVALPMSLLFEGHVVLLASMVGSMVGFYGHSNTRAELAFLRPFILSPSFHRIHHSTNPAHFGKNFCAFTPLWDIAFRTAYFPKRGEWPETGLSDYPEPRSIAGWLAAPWRQDRGYAAVGTVNPASDPQ